MIGADLLRRRLNDPPARAEKVRETWAPGEPILNKDQYNIAQAALRRMNRAIKYEKQQKNKLAIVRLRLLREQVLMAIEQWKKTAPMLIGKDD